MNYEQQIEKFLNKTGGIITTSDCNNLSIPTIYLARLVKNNKLFRVKKGIYITQGGNYDELYFYQHQYSKIVYSYFASLYLQGIGDIIPDKIDVTVYQGYKFNNMPNNFKVHYVKPELYELGIIEVDTIFGNKVKVYSLERTFCDFVYNKQAIDQEAYIKLIKYYANYKNKDLKQLYSIAKQMGITKKVQVITELTNE